VLLGTSDHPHHAGRRVHGLQTCLTSSQICTMHFKQHMNGLYEGRVAESGSLGHIQALGWCSVHEGVNPGFCLIACKQDIFCTSFVHRWIAISKRSRLIPFLST